MTPMPYISFVVVGRNDNYGGDFLHRINVFVKSLLTLCEIHSLDSELIIVEWNPPEDRPSLKDAITWPDIPRRHMCVRMIRVSKQIHNSLPNPVGLFLFEYLGKNVGVRRARGEYVLATNPDVIFNEDLIKYLTLRTLSPRCFYRIDRYDVKSPVPLDIPVEKQLEYCTSNVLRVHSCLWSCESNESKLSKRFFGACARYLKRRILHFPFTPLHTNASGDFFLMHRGHWNTIRGYPELEMKGKSHQIDGLVLYMAQFSGLKQKILRNPLRLYHQDHGRPEGGKIRSSAVDLAYRQLIKERKLILFNTETWGLGNEMLSEEVF